MAKNIGGRRDRDGGGLNIDGLIAVAVDKDKSSQNALKWAVEHLLTRGQTIVLVHVKPRASSVTTNSNSTKNGDSSLVCGDPEGSDKQLFLPFRCLCSRKDIQCKDVVLEESDVAKALVEYANQVIIEVLVVGASSKGGFLRFNKAPDIPGTITKTAPEFCTVYVITKGKLSTKRIASRVAPSVSPLRVQLLQASLKPPPPLPTPATTNTRERPSFESRRSVDGQSDAFRSHRRGLNGRSYGELSMPDSDISFISSGRPSVERCSEPNRTPPRLSNLSELDYGGFESMTYDQGSLDISSPTGFSTGPFENERVPSASQGMDDVEAEMRRLKLELKQTMDMYNTACKEALTARNRATELERWKLEEERKLEEAKLAEEAALAIAEKERVKCKAATEAAEAAQRFAEIESRKRANAELKDLRESEERTNAVNALEHSDMHSSTNSQTSSPR